jgi:hypothetical protein
MSASPISPSALPVVPQDSGQGPAGKGLLLAQVAAPGIERGVLSFPGGAKNNITPFRPGGAPASGSSSATSGSNAPGSGSSAVSNPQTKPLGPLLNGAPVGSPGATGNVEFDAVYRIATEALQGRRNDSHPVPGLDISVRELIWMQDALTDGEVNGKPLSAPQLQKLGDLQREVSRFWQTAPAQRGVASGATAAAVSPKTGGGQLSAQQVSQAKARGTFGAQQGLHSAQVQVFTGLAQQFTGSYRHVTQLIGQFYAMASGGKAAAGQLQALLDQIGQGRQQMTAIAASLTGPNGVVDQLNVTQSQSRSLVKTAALGSAWQQASRDMTANYEAARKQVGAMNGLLGNNSGQGALAQFCRQGQQFVDGLKSGTHGALPRVPPLLQAWPWMNAAKEQEIADNIVNAYKAAERTLSGASHQEAPPRVVPDPFAEELPPRHEDYGKGTKPGSPEGDPSSKPTPPKQPGEVSPEPPLQQSHPSLPGAGVGPNRMPPRTNGGSGPIPEWLSPSSPVESTAPSEQTPQPAIPPGTPSQEPVTASATGSEPSKDSDASDSPSPELPPERWAGVWHSDSMQERIDAGAYDPQSPNFDAKRSAQLEHQVQRLLATSVNTSLDAQRDQGGESWTVREVRAAPAPPGQSAPLPSFEIIVGNHDNSSAFKMTATPVWRRPTESDGLNGLSYQIGGQTPLTPLRSSKDSATPPRPAGALPGAAAPARGAERGVSQPAAPSSSAASDGSYLMDHLGTLQFQPENLSRDIGFACRRAYEQANPSRDAWNAPDGWEVKKVEALRVETASQHPTYSVMLENYQGTKELYLIASPSKGGSDPTYTVSSDPVRSQRGLTSAFRSYGKAGGAWFYDMASRQLRLARSESELLEAQTKEWVFVDVSQSTGEPPRSNDFSRLASAIEAHLGGQTTPRGDARKFDDARIERIERALRSGQSLIGL